MTIVKELYPDVSQPTVTISGPIQRRLGHGDARQHRAADRTDLAGTPDMQTYNSVVQQGQASITAIFDIDSGYGHRSRADEQGDSGGREISADEYDAADGQSVRPDAVRGRHPGALFEETLALAARALRRPTSSRRSSNKFPAFRLSTSAASVTPAYEVVVDPARLTAANLTLNDVINTLQSDNQRVPGGFAYEPNRQTTIDIRGDIQNLDYGPQPGRSFPIGRDRLRRRELDRRPSRELLGRPLGPTRGRQLLERNQLRRAHRRRRQRERRLRAAAAVRPHQRPDGALPSGPKGFDRQRSRRLEQRPRSASADRTALPRDQLPRHPRPVEVYRAADRHRQPHAVLAILLTGIAMIFFLRSWRSAIVVCVSIPTSLAIAITVMR